MKKKIILMISMILTFAPCIYMTYVTLSNPDLTETRLFLNFWKEYLASICVIGIGMGLYEYTVKKI